VITAAGRGFVCHQCGQRYDAGGYCPHDGNRLADTDDPLLGTEVGRYRLARLIGEGGMGRVYLAVQPAIGSRVAIKILSDQCARNPELLERFFAEARAVNLIRHESIVSVIDMAQLPDGRPFIVMEYVEGQTLAAIVGAGPVPLGGLVQVMSEVLSALSAAHAIGIVHRDLKPDNILVTVEGHAKVLDFGIAKLAPELHQQLSPRTRTGALLGTPQYMAPEQISGSGSVDPRTDLYAAGVVLYELATGRQPFAGETLFDLMRAHLEQPPRPPRALRPELPPAFEHVILTALAKQPDDRFPSAAVMSHALHLAAAALPADQWRSLSSRGLTSGVGPRPVTSDVPLAYRPTRPAGPAPTLEGAGRIGLVIGAFVVAAVAVAVTLFVVTRGTAGDRSAVAVAPGSAGEPATSPAGAADTPAPNAPPLLPAGSAASPASAPPLLPAGSAASPASAPPLAPAGSAASPASAPPLLPAGSAASPASAPPRGPRGTPVSARPVVPQPTAAPAAPIDAGPGPVIVNGGSAADHGVVIGPNVTMGPNVVIGSATPPGAKPEELERPADYDPKHFDPVAYLPKAQRLARELVPDAQLTSFEFDPVFADGHVDLTLESRDHSYDFRSPQRSGFPAGRPRNMPIDRPCRISVDIGVSSVSARVLNSDSCDEKLVRAPHCRFAAVWKQALAGGTPSDVVARIGWLRDESWFFDIDFAGKGGGVSSFADRCP
jgi:tRNA A-37 threonylcarbamoyl transferase component Bud32